MSVFDLMISKEEGINKIQLIINELKYDSFEPKKKYEGNKLGTFNSKFATDYLKLFYQCFDMNEIRQIILNYENDANKMKYEFSKLIKPINTAITKSLTLLDNDENKQKSQGLTIEDSIDNTKSNGFY